MLPFLDKPFPCKLVVQTLLEWTWVLSSGNNYLSWWACVFFWRQHSHFLLILHFLNILRLFSFLRCHTPEDVAYPCVWVHVCVYTCMCAKVTLPSALHCKSRKSVHGLLLLSVLLWRARKKPVGLVFTSEGMRSQCSHALALYPWEATNCSQRASHFGKQVMKVHRPPQRLTVILHAITFVEILYKMNRFIKVRIFFRHNPLDILIHQ